jgi:hypothetical protein
MKRIMVLIFAALIITGCSNYETSDQCKTDCLKSNYEDGRCEWPGFMNENLESLFSEIENKGPCLIERTKHCGNPGQCNCYCINYKENTECSTDTDCVPATCCHPDSCVPVGQKPLCKGIVCTAECVPETMDCGQGYCACTEGACTAVIN